MAAGLWRRAHTTFPNAASGSVFIGNSCFDTRPRSAMTQAYGYNEVGKGLKDIKQFGNDYDRNRIGSDSLLVAFSVTKRLRKFMQMTRLARRFPLR